MNILIAVPWDQERGGVATVVNNLAKYLTEHGHGVVFLHPGDAGRPRPKKTRTGFTGYELNLRPPSVSRRPWRSRLAFWLFLVPTLYKVRGLLRSEAIDIVNVHYPVEGFVHFGFGRALFGVPLVVSTHGADLIPNGDEMRTYPWALRVLLALCDRVTAPSNAHLEHVLSIFPSLRSKSIPVRNGIDVSEFDLSGVEGGGTTVRGPYALNIAAHNPKKGIDTLLHAFAIIRERGGNLSLVQVGDGPLRGQLEEMAERLELGDRVTFLGRQNLVGVRRLIRGCTVFAFPSRSEPFGIALLEAMLLRKPVVASSIGGIPEIVTDGENGFLVPPNDPQALAEALMRVSEDPSDRVRVGANARKTVIESFTHENMGAAFESVFLDVVCDRGRAAR